MAESIITTRPTPPRNCITLLQSKTIWVVSFTSTTDSPVVVYPLTTSNIACTKLSCPDITKGRADKIKVVIHDNNTTIPPS